MNIRIVKALGFVCLLPFWLVCFLIVLLFGFIYTALCEIMDIDCQILC